MVLKDLPPNLVEQGTIIAHPISEADYLRLYSGQATEWVEGYVIEMASSTVSHRLNRFRDRPSNQDKISFSVRFTDFFIIPILNLFLGFPSTLKS